MNLSSEKATEALSIAHTLREHGYSAYLVGGCVRDLLLGREPADYDVTTSAIPDEVMRIFPQTYAVGAQFGVVLVPVRKDSAQGEAANYAIEVATFRSDGAYSDGRHPDQIQFSKDPQFDVQRRDFTINGMLLDPDTREVLDYVGGREDLKRGVIRTIGEPHQRFTEDKLRMLRAVRFAARFGYKIEDKTFAALQQLAPQIHQVSRERIRDEILKMLTEGHARRAFELLGETQLLEQVLPEVKKMQGVAQPPQYHPEGDVWIHTLMLLEGLPAGCSKTLALGALLHDVGKPPTFRIAPDRIRFDGHAEVGTKMAEEICRRFRLSNEDTAQVMSLVANHMRFGDVRKMKESTLKRFFRLPKFEEQLELHRLDCSSSHRDLSLYEFAKMKYYALPEEQIRPTPLITGNDLIAAGYKPGPRFKDLLTAVEDAQLDGSINTKEEALGLVRGMFAQKTTNDFRIFFMPQQLTRLTVFISCPNDLVAEKKVVVSAIQELNATLQETYSIILNVMTWESDVVPGIGADAQSVINTQISGKYDIYIGLLGARFGSKTLRAESGTQEEFEMAYERYRNSPELIRVLFYFKSTTVESIYKVDLDQLQKVIAFRKKLEDAGALYSDFSDADILLKAISNHLRKLVAEQWDGRKWKVLSPLSPDHRTASGSLDFVLVENKNSVDQESPEDSLSAGFLDLIVTAESALAVALQALMNIGTFTERTTEETKSTAQKLNSAGEQKNARQMKSAIDHLSHLLLKHSSDLRREVAVLEGSLSRAFASTETALRMYLDDQLGDPAQLKGLTTALSPLMIAIRGSRQMAEEMQKTVSSLPGYTRDFKAALRQTRQVYAEMSATMTVLLGRTITAQENFARLTGGGEDAANQGTATPPVSGN